MRRDHEKQSRTLDGSSSWQLRVVKEAVAQMQNRAADQGFSDMLTALEAKPFFP